MAKSEGFKKPFWPTVVAASVFGGLMIIGFEIGRSAGEDKPVAKKPQSTLLAKYEKEKEKPKTTATTEKPPEPTKPKAEPSKPEPTKPKPAPEPTKAAVEPTKPAPPPPPKPEPPTVMVSYQEKILPIFKAKCNLCHGDPLIKGELDLRSLASIKKSPNIDKVLNPGNPELSEVYTQIQDGSMPQGKGDKLTSAELKLVYDWVKSGGK